MRTIEVTEPEFRLVKSFMEALASESLYPLEGWAVDVPDNTTAKRFLKRNGLQKPKKKR